MFHLSCNALRVKDVPQKYWQPKEQAAATWDENQQLKEAINMIKGKKGCIFDAVGLRCWLVFMYEI